MTEPVLLPPLPPVLPLARVRIVESDGAATEVFGSWLSKLQHWLSFMGDPNTPRSDGTLAEYLRPPEPEPPPPEPEEPVPPSFSAYRSAALSAAGNSALTKITCDAEEWDSDSYHDTATGRFTPLVAGKYLVTAAVGITTVEDGSEVQVILYKNGTAHRYGVSYATGFLNQSPHSQVVAMVSMNGTTDYLEIYVTHDDTSSEPVATGLANTFFQSVRVSP